MTEEQAEQFICDYLANARDQFGNPEQLREGINKEITKQGWEVKSIKSFGQGFSFNVKPVGDQSSPGISSGSSAGGISGGTSSSQSGFSCVKCKAFNAYAEPNQPDGTYICYSCRS